MSDEIQNDDDLIGGDEGEGGDEPMALRNYVAATLNPAPWPILLEIQADAAAMRQAADEAQGAFMPGYVKTALANAARFAETVAMALDELRSASL